MKNAGQTNISLTTLKQGFQEYLEQQALAQGTEISQNQSVSIFLHSEDFKNYLIDEIGVDSSILSQNINEIMQNITDGSLFNDPSVDKAALEELEQEAALDEEEDSDGEVLPKDPDDEDPQGVDETDDKKDDSFMLQALNEAFLDEEVISTLDGDNDGELSEDEINEFLFAINGSDEGVDDELTFEELAQGIKTIYDGSYQELLNQKKQEQNEYLLNKVFEDKDVIAALDLDGDNKLSEEEKAKFKEFITGYATDGDELTKDDIKQAFNDILDGKFDYSEIKSQFVSDAEKDENPQQTETVQSAPQQSPTVSAPMSGGAAGSYRSSNSSYRNTAAAQPLTIENMDLEQLKAEKEVREQKVTEAQDEINSITSGEKFASEESEVESLKQEYLEAVKEELSEEDKNTLQTHIENIDNKEKEIDESNKKIADYDIKISDQENTVSNIETTLASLKQTQAQLNSTSTDDEEKRSQIETKKREIAQKISELENQKTEENNNLQTLKDEKKETEDNLTTQQGELEELKTTKQEFEESIKEKLSDTAKEKMEAYNNAKDNLETKKAQALSEAQGNLAAAQAAVKEVDAKINEKEAQKTAGEYAVNPGADEFLAQLKSLGGDAPNRFGDLCKTLNMSEQEAASYLVELCGSEEWGNGCIEPTLLVAQICQESGFQADIVGDGGAALGLGQFHKCAVDEVNNQYGTNYTYDDRANPTKALEMMVLLLKYDYSRTNSTYGMLAMYNQGHASAINETAGRNYVNHVLNRIGQSM